MFLSRRVLVLAVAIPFLLSVSNGWDVSSGAYLESRATFYGSPEFKGTPQGACGYAEYGRDAYGGDVTATSRLYRNGTGCGSCYLVKCTHPALCNEEGVKVLVTDYGHGDRTDFILSAHAFAKLGTLSFSSQLVAMGVLNIQYTRVPCEYPGYNMAFKIHETSTFLHYLALIFYYQGGARDIVAVSIHGEGSAEWRMMNRNHGAVWDCVAPPTGALYVRVLLSAEGGGSQQWVSCPKAIPAYWKAGAVYDAGIQLT